MSDGLGEVGAGYRHREAVKAKPFKDAWAAIRDNFLIPVGAQVDAIVNPIQAPAQANIPAPDGGFEDWYRGLARTYNLPPDPDRSNYDYRAAYKAGVRGPVNGAWPDTYKRVKFQ